MADIGRPAPWRLTPRESSVNLFRWTLRLAGSQRQPKHWPSVLQMENTTFVDYNIYIYYENTFYMLAAAYVLHLNFSLELPFVFCLPKKVDKQSFQKSASTFLWRHRPLTTVLRGEKRSGAVGSVSEVSTMGFAQSCVPAKPGWFRYQPNIIKSVVLKFLIVDP